MSNIVYNNSHERLIIVEVGNGYILGVLHLPVTIITYPFVVLICGGINAERSDVNRMSVNFSRFLSNAGIASVRFDYRGLGVSSGESWEMTVETKIEDCMQLIKHLTIEEGYEKVILLGYSDGAKVAVEVAANHNRIIAAALWSPTLISVPTDVKLKVKPILIKELGKILWPLKGILLGPEYYRVSQKKSDQAALFWEKLNDQEKKILVILSDTDKLVFTTKEMIHKETRPHLTQYVIEGADHLYSEKVFKEQLYSLSLDWLISLVKNED